MLSILLTAFALSQVPDFSSVESPELRNEKAKTQVLVAEVNRLRSQVKDLNAKLKPTIDNQTQITKVIVPVNTIEKGSEITRSSAPIRYERKDKCGYTWWSVNRRELELTVEDLNNEVIAHPYRR